MEKQKIYEEARVIRQDPLAPGIYSLWIRTGTAETAEPGQFVSLYSNDGARLLPRPISIAETNRMAGALRLVYRVAGQGTREFSHLLRDDTIRIMGPLGNGYPLQGGRTLLIGGGVGVPPLLELAKELAGRNRTDQTHQPALSVTAVLGYRDRNLFLKRDFERYARTIIATDDGSAGTHGTVLDALREHETPADVIYACGPLPMLRAVKQYAMQQQIRCFVSLEERMACGVGACLGCVVRTVETDSHSHVKNRRVCADGPVFRAEEVDI